MTKITREQEAHLVILVNQAKEGDGKALEKAIRMIQPSIFALAQRFLWHPQDAEDATQEVLVRVVTGLSGFRGDSQFSTWVYRVAFNTLLSINKKPMEDKVQGFDDFAAQLENEALLQTQTYDTPEQSRLIEEVKIGCTLGMLLCLDRPQRMVYILGEILELEHGIMAEILQQTKDNVRQKLSRARKQISTFMNNHCGVVNPDNRCRCEGRIQTSIAQGCVNKDHLIFTTSDKDAQLSIKAQEHILELEETRRVAALYQSYPDIQMRGDFSSWIKTILESHQLN